MMKEFKIILAIIITFVIAFATSALLEFNFINSRWPRYALVVIGIAVELVIGLMYVKSEVEQLNKKES